MVVKGGYSEYIKETSKSDTVGKRSIDDQEPSEQITIKLKKIEADENGEENVKKPNKIKMHQMTIEMRHADFSKMIKLPEKVFRSWEIKQSSDNLADQLSLITGKPKQEIISDAIIITANLLKRNPDLINEILNEYKPIKRG